MNWNNGFIMVGTLSLMVASIFGALRLTRNCSYAVRHIVSTVAGWVAMGIMYLIFKE